MKLAWASIPGVMLAVQLLHGCAVLKEVLPATQDPVVQSERARKALASLRALQDIDALIRLDNGYLQGQIAADLQGQAQASEEFELTRLRVRFDRQHIALHGDLAIANPGGAELQATVDGRVLLAFSGNQLIWLPQFDRLELADSAFRFAGREYPQATPALLDDLLARANREITDPLIVQARNVVELRPVPLGRIEVGAEVAGMINSSGRGSRALGGVFTVAGSAILIEPRVTSIALDLQFVPSFSTCPADVYVSRSAFANEISAREPVGISRLVDQSGETRHFFTEISGAEQSTVIVHYWFADGQPVALEELPVEPSFRWRTWSSKTIDRPAGNWEVIVVEKSTGCILHSLALRSDPQVEASSDADRATARATFDQLVAEFGRRTAGFSTGGEDPEIALIEVPRTFLDRVLHQSVRDLSIDVDFDASPGAGNRLSAELLPFDAEKVSCAARECASPRTCAAGFTQCARRRDTRDCSTCLFRNPLNGRCVNEAADPICEAARAARNERYEVEWEACRNRETAAKLECERLRNQELRSCELEAVTEISRCEASRRALVEFTGPGALATLSGQFEESGGLRANFSNFEIGEDLASIRMNLGFTASLDLRGTLATQPGRPLGPLSDCLDAWQGGFRAEVVMPLLASSMIATLQPSGRDLRADWSGYVVSAAVHPSPLEALFVENPALLADCDIGLTIDDVVGGLSGEHSDFFAGRLAIEIQPLPSLIEFAPATVEYGESRYSAAPQISASHLKYVIGAP